MATFPKRFFLDKKSFAYEALRAARYTRCGGAEPAEAISVCFRIPSGDEEIWLRDWQLARDRAVQAAKASLTKNDRRGAQHAFERASIYYRAAEFYRRDNVFEDELISKNLIELNQKDTNTF
ncbi:hypothetical protein CNYM01_07127 [Colletotrichum nymphaeae SA-01]|uniref:Uncharacterized protein n=1 Tax=Colletotrichum nymphaeae SA-01 TaxID=1460502 RepID=A0A135TC68_9PEZI|nr:hypothetical protein CNYM01_07127 [Colletotrichum nymphaeae SA-01]